MNYKKDLESLHDPASDLPNLLYLNHALNISKTHSDVSCPYMNDLKIYVATNVVCTVTVQYINFLTGFMVSYAADCSLVTIVVRGCSEEKRFFREKRQLLGHLIYWVKIT